MNKKELVELMFDNLDKKVSRKVINDVVTEFMETILKTIKKGHSIKLVGFLNILLKEYGARNARNPKTGAISKIPASVKAVVKVGNLIKEAAKGVSTKTLKDINAKATKTTTTKKK